MGESDERPNGEPLSERVANWVNTSGHALELRVARELAQPGPVGSPQVRLSYAYEDLRMPGTIREGDVSATWLLSIDQTHYARIDLCVECKGRSNMPWVLFDGPGRSPIPKYTDWCFERTPTRLTNAWQWRFGHPFNVRTATHVAAANVRGEKGDGRNHAADAVRQVVSAAMSRNESVLPEEAQAARERRDGAALAMRGQAVMALVVTRARLFRCGLDREGQVAVEEVTHGDVFDPGGTGKRIFVVTESGFPEWLAGFTERLTCVSEPPVPESPFDPNRRPLR